MKKINPNNVVSNLSLKAILPWSLDIADDILKTAPTDIHVVQSGMK